MSEDERGRTDDATETMADVSHTHPHTDETFGAVYRRGPAVADGGRDGPTTETEAEAETETESMRDVDHTPPHGEGANEVWARGRETDGDDPVGDDVDDE